MCVCGFFLIKLLCSHVFTPGVKLIYGLASQVRISNPLLFFSFFFSFQQEFTEYMNRNDHFKTRLELCWGKKKVWSSDFHLGHAHLLSSPPLCSSWPADSNDDTRAQMTEQIHPRPFAPPSRFFFRARATFLRPYVNQTYRLPVSFSPPILGGTLSGAAALAGCRSGALGTARLQGAPAFSDLAEHVPPLDPVPAWRRTLTGTQVRPFRYYPLYSSK